MRFFAGLAFALTLASGSGCTTGSSSQPTPLVSVPNPVAPTPQPAPPPPTPFVPPVVATAVKISGNAALGSIGEISRLTATATLVDGSTKDVTAEAKWSTLNASVIALGKPGEFTAVSFGAAYVTASYSNRGNSLYVSATPPGTFAVLGRVREPGGGSMFGARVTDNTVHRSVTTDGEGGFTIGELPRSEVSLLVEKENFEPATLVAPIPVSAYVDIPVQRIVKLTAGDTVTPDRLAPNDVTYQVGAIHCNSCRMIRIAVPAPGTLHMRATWSIGGKLTLLTDAGIAGEGTAELFADLAVSKAGEVVVYLGTPAPASISTHIPFKLETSMR
jgi:hypothetical protein